MTEYDGHKTYQTWIIANWIENDEGLLDFFCEKAEEHLNDNPDDDRAILTLTAWLEEYFTDQAPESEDHWISLLFESAFGCVEWQEIAEHLINRVTENTSE